MRNYLALATVLGAAAGIWGLYRDVLPKEPATLFVDEAEAASPDPQRESRALRTVDAPEPTPDQTHQPKSDVDLTEAWGVRVERLTLSAGGYMLDFRFTIEDPEKAKPLLGRKTKPYLVHQKSGAKFVVPNTPKVGPLRTDNADQAGRTLFILFANPAQTVKSGDKVTVVIGECEIKDLVVP